MPGRFVASAEDAASLRDIGLPEFAVIGRSNVGKSSLLTMLLQSEKLVRTSKNPGQTKTINLYALDDVFALVDLPGYGYAKVSKDTRDKLRAMIHDYVANRHRLAGVLQLFDARRDDVTAEDIEMNEWISENNRAVLLVVTKADLVPKNRLLTQVRKLEQALGVPPGQALITSSLKNKGREEIISHLMDVARAWGRDTAV